MSKAFVIHIHSGYGPVHYDLMLPQGEALATWQFSACPADLQPGQTLLARRIQDHRTAYLDYEGPVSGGRGRVEAFDRGECELASVGESRWEFVLSGRRLRGRFELRRNDRSGDSAEADEWSFHRLDEAGVPSSVR